MKPLYYLILTLTFLSNNLLAQNTNLKFNVLASTKSEIRDSRFVSARIFSFNPQVKLIYKLEENLKFYLDLKGLLETGSNDSLYIDEYRPRREIILNEAKFKYRFLDFIDLSFGALDQGRFNSPLFLSQTAFTGISQEAKFDFYGLKTYVLLQQLIPNNQNLSSRLGGTDEGTPKFYSETIGLKRKDGVFSFTVEYTMFAFENLSRSVAHQSRFLGNQVTGTGQENASFVYPFKGHNTYAEVGILLSSLSLSFDGHYTHNNETPDDRSDAYLIRGKVSFSNFEIGGFHFLSESDAAPSYYNSLFYGHNNTEGNGAFFVYKKNDEKLFFRISYIKGTLIDSLSIYQDDFTGSQLTIRKQF